MPRTLYLDHEFWSFRGGLSLRDEDGTVVCEARGGFSWVSPTWSIERDGQAVATVRQKILAWRPCWRVDGALGEFMIRRCGNASERGHLIIGGRFDGARMSPTPRERTLVLEGRDGEIARAHGEEIELDRVDADTILLVALALAVHHMDRMADATRR